MSGMEERGSCFQVDNWIGLMERELGETSNGSSDGGASWPEQRRGGVRRAM